jgi:hypothetical protein
MQLGAASVDSQMQDIEREAMDMQLQDKLLEYKREMGLLPASTGGDIQGAIPARASGSQPEALPAKGETSSGN